MQFRRPALGDSTTFGGFVRRVGQGLAGSTWSATLGHASYGDASRAPQAPSEAGGRRRITAAANFPNRDACQPDPRLARSAEVVALELENAGAGPGEAAATVLNRALALLTAATAGTVIVVGLGDHASSEDKGQGQKKGQRSLEQ